MFVLGNPDEKEARKGDAHDTRSSPDGLRELTMKVSELVQTGALDPQFGGKIFRRIRDEAELMADLGGFEGSARPALWSALEFLAAEVHGREADLTCRCECTTPSGGRNYRWHEHRKQSGLVNRTTATLPRQRVICGFLRAERFFGRPCNL